MTDCNKDDWERVLRQKRELERMMEAHTFADVMAREKSPYLASSPGVEGNRQQRRAQARKNQR